MARSGEFCYVVRKMPERGAPKHATVLYVQTIIQGLVMWTAEKDDLALRLSFAGWKDILPNLQRAAKTPIMVERIGA